MSENFTIKGGEIFYKRHPLKSTAYEFDIEFLNSKDKFYLWWGHLNLIALLKQHDTFTSVLDIGAGEGCLTKIFKFLNKETTSIEPGEVTASIPGYIPIIPDYKDSYLNIKFNRQFDVIWCSHVLEHIRNPGIFLNKIYSDLKEEGILAITVPYNDGDDIEHIVDGHIGKYSIAIIIYNLVISGFDCSNIHINFCEYEMCVLLRKKSNRLKITSDTANSFGSLEKFFPEVNQTKIFIGNRLLSMTFKKQPINWIW